MFAIIVPKVYEWKKISQKLPRHLHFRKTQFQGTFAVNPAEQNIIPLIMAEIFKPPENLHWACTSSTFRTELQQKSEQKSDAVGLFQTSNNLPG